MFLYSGTSIPTSLTYSLSAVPSAPRGLSLEPVPNNSSQLSATWELPDPANGVITGYTLYCNRSDQQFYPEQLQAMSEPIPLGISGDEPSATVMNLDPFTNYNCSISASTSAGEGDRSSEVRQRTNESGKFCLQSIYGLHQKMFSVVLNRHNL